MWNDSRVGRRSMLSYARGPELPTIEQTIGQVFTATAAAFAERDALISVHQGIRLTWGELAERVEEVARGLAGIGLKRGDRAGVWATNCIEWLLLQLACARTGIVLVNINPANRSHELRYVLAQSGMRALFLHEQDDRSNYREILAEATAGQTLALERALYLDGPSWGEMLERGVDPGPVPDDPNEVVNIQYTSGTTGSPKGVLLTHRNIVNNGAVIADGLQASERDRICVPVPLYHCFGCVIGSMTWIVSGAAMILPAPRFNAR